jgi:predicted enzyme related to lactoylglutathione lyase
MAESIGGFIWYELMTTDADAASRFYTDVVGWQVAASGMPNMDYRELNTATGPVGGILQLDQKMLDGGAQPVWLGYVAVEDVEATTASVTDAGGRVLVPPTDIPDVGRFAMIADPQGIPIYVMHVVSGEPSQAFRPSTDGHCAWNELATPDQAGALRFYTSLFGWTLGETMPMGDLGDYQMIDLGESTIGAVMTAAPDGSPPMWRFYFRVPNLGDAVAKIETGGGTVLHGPQEVPGDDEIVIAMDPLGAMFALVATKP